MAGQGKVRLVTYSDNQLRGTKIYFWVDENGIMLTKPTTDKDKARDMLKKTRFV